MKRTQNERLKTIYDDLTQAIGDVIAKRGVTEQEFEAAVNWLVDLGNAGEIPLFAMQAFGLPLAQVNHGVAYANPDKDGASTWYPAGPAYVPGAPLLDPTSTRRARLLVQPVSPGHLPQTNVLRPSLPTQIWDDQLPSVSRGRHH